MAADQVVNQQLVEGGGGHGAQQGFRIGLSEVVQKQRRGDQVLAAGERGTDRIGLEELGLQALRPGRCGGEGDGFIADVTAVHLQIDSLPPAQASDGPHRVAPTAGHIQDAQPPRGVLARQAPDGGKEAARTAGQGIDPSEAEQGCLVVLGIKARLVHHLGPQLPLAQLTPQDWQGHSQGQLEIGRRGLQTVPLGVPVVHQP